VHLSPHEQERLLLSYAAALVPDAAVRVTA
jgi:hypothetical protein